MKSNSQHLVEMKILIVDDTPANIDILRKTLEDGGFKISVAPSGEIALKIVARSVPDLILLDVMMPGMDGFQTCRKIKSQEISRDVPIIFITAKTDITDVIKGFSVGGVDYITKPFHQEEVLIRVQTQLQLRRLIQEKEGLIEELTSLKDALELSSKTDPLTTLANRRGMQEKLDYEKLRFERNKKVFCLFLADIDYFKKVNDTYGHDAGDHILIHLAKILEANTRKQDVICRWGGEEFLALLPETTLEGGMKLAETIRSKVETEKFSYENKEISLTMSFGVSLYVGNELDRCIKLADEGLYHAKSTGRNKVIALNEEKNKDTLEVESASYPGLHR